MVGMDLLVEAVGIGKGKHDLTGTVSGHARSKRTIPKCPEIPVGKSLSSLTYEDIVKFLKDSRLSKANSNDLFWEAVWPRLLGRGWHSEQPKDLTFRGSQISLVFLIPGVDKFSRRELTRGSHYFDSVGDVLNKVASDPKLMELASDGAKESDNYNSRCKWQDSNSGQNCPTNQKHRCYLRPKLLNTSPELFTIVDTSLFPREIPFKLSALQSLPLDTVHSNRASSHSGDLVDSDSDNLVCSDISPNDQQMSATITSEDSKFDQNKPQSPPDFDASEPFCMDNFSPKEPSVSSGKKQVTDASKGVSTNSVQRQGTRNRMPTAKTLAAVACEFFGTKKKRRRMNTSPANDLP